MCCSKIEVTFSSHAKSSHGSKEGIYTRDGMINGYDYWINADDDRAIWYNPPAKDWSIGDKDDLGKNLQGLMTVENFDKNEANCPTGNHKWEFVHNGEWTETNDVLVKCSMPSTPDTAVSEFLFYKNNVWAHEKIKQPHNSPLVELLYFKNNVWSKTDFLKHPSSKSTPIPPKTKNITVEKGQSEVKNTSGFNTLSFFEGIICIVISSIIGFVIFKLYIYKKARSPNKFKQFSNPFSTHNSLEIPSKENVQSTSNGSASIMM